MKSEWLQTIKLGTCNFNGEVHNAVFFSSKTGLWCYFGDSNLVNRFWQFLVANQHTDSSVWVRGIWYNTLTYKLAHLELY